MRGSINFKWFKIRQTHMGPSTLIKWMKGHYHILKWKEIEGEEDPGKSG